MLIQWYTIISSWKNLKTPYFFPQNVFKHYSFTLTKNEFHMIQKEPYIIPKFREISVIETRDLSPFVQEAMEIIFA